MKKRLVTVQGTSQMLDCVSCLQFLRELDSSETEDYLLIGSLCSSDENFVEAIIDSAKIWNWKKIFCLPLDMEEKWLKGINTDRLDCISTVKNQFLTSSSDVILFSAAVPFQGGQGHINERPISYWVNLFEARKYTVYDFIRPQIWDNQSVDWWYRQNILIFSKKQDVFTDLPPFSFQANTMIHPELYNARMSKYKHLIDTLGLEVDKLDYLNYVVPQGKLAKIKLALKILLRLSKKMLISK